MNGISGLFAYSSFPGGSYSSLYGAASSVRNAQNAGKINAAGYGAKKAASPDTPVERVRPTPAVRADASAPISRSIPSWNLNAADEAVRMRIQYPGNTPQDSASTAAAPLKNSGAENPMNLPEAAWEGLPAYSGIDAGETATRLRIQYPGADDQAAEAALPLPGSQADEAAEAALPLPGSQADEEAPDDGEPVGAEGVQKAAEEGRCETCEQRKYQDGSDDMSVSFQTPTRIAPENVASTVRGHEMEHVSHEQIKAQQEDRKVVSQSVTLHTDICPECGKTYISGGTTRTVTAANPEQPAEEPKQDGQKTPSGIA